jgi:CheY-like chemotaxis protein
LIVDDNPVNSRLASMVLEKADFHVRTAFDGEEALRVVAELHPILS